MHSNSFTQLMVCRMVFRSNVFVHRLSAGDHCEGRCSAGQECLEVRPWRDLPGVWLSRSCRIAACSAWRSPVLVVSHTPLMLPGKTTLQDPERFVADMGALFDTLTWEQIADDTSGVMQVRCCTVSSDSKCNSRVVAPGPLVLAECLDSLWLFLHDSVEPASHMSPCRR
jgi:hypothetical protein